MGKLFFMLRLAVFGLRWLAVVAFAFGGVVLFGSGAARADVPVVAQAEDRSEYLKADSLFRERKFREAIAVLDPYLVAHPRDARALVLRGDAKADLGDNESALRGLQ